MRRNTAIAYCALRGLINFNLRALIDDIHIRKAEEAFMFKEPGSWEDRKSRIAHRWATPLIWIDWWIERAVYRLRQWSFLELLELLSRFAVLVAVFSYVGGADERQKIKLYQAWAVINSAQGKGGSGGRIKALEELAEEAVPLDGVNLAGAWLHAIQLPKASLRNANFETAKLRHANLQGSDLYDAKLQWADLLNAHLNGTDLSEAELQGSNLRNADLHGSKLWRANFRDADLSYANLKGADLSGAHLEKRHFRRSKPRKSGILGC